MAAVVFADSEQNEVKLAAEFRCERYLILNLRVYFLLIYQYLYTQGIF